MTANAAIYFVQLLYVSIEKPFCGFQLWKLNDYLQSGVSIHAYDDSDSSTTKGFTQSNFKHKSQYNTMHPHAQMHQCNMQRWAP